MGEVVVVVSGALNPNAMLETGQHVLSVCIPKSAIHLLACADMMGIGGAMMGMDQQCLEG